MKKFILLQIIGLIIIGRPSSSLADIAREELMDAAFSGDINFLQESYDEFKTNKIVKGVSPADLVGEALAGHQYEIVKWCATEDPDANKLSGWFGSQQMDVKAAKIIFNQVPNLKTNYGNKSLDGAILADNSDVLKFLLEAGAKPTNGRRPPPPLIAATQFRRFEAISLLLKHGFDPYERSPEGISSAGLAIMLKSSSLLKALDQEKKYSTELASIEQELHPAKNSPFAGTWVDLVDLHEGFGSASITIYPDGTAILGSGVGGMPCIVKESDKTAKLILLEGSPHGELRPNEKQAIDIKIDGNELVLAMGGEGRRMKKFNTKEPREQLVARRPYHVHIEKLCISSSDDLYIQINGHFIKIPIAELISGAQETPYGLTVIEKNMVRWEEFQKGEIPKNILSTSTEVPFVNKHADPRYSVGWGKVGFDHEHLASTSDGNDFTLFPSSTTEFYHGPNTGQFGEHVDCFVLLSKKPFAHGKDWLMFFFLKSKTSDVPRPSPW